MEHQTLVSALKQTILGEVRTDTETLSTYSEDASIFTITPQCVVSPKNTADVQALVRYAHEHPHDLSLTARSAGTDMSGGPLTHSVVVDFLTHFNETPTIDAVQKTASTQPGVFYREFEKETLTHNLLLPCYTASRELNTVGGMVANNSGGEKSLTYGKTEHWVRTIEMVLNDGSVHTFRKLTRAELEHEKEQDTRAGEIYRNMETLITEHWDTIRAAKPDVSKDSTGYPLWHVYDAEADTFDLTRIITGSQGTLGLITNITLALTEPKPHARMVVMFLRPKDMHVLGQIVNTVLTYRPESFESYDDHTFLIMLKVLPSMIKRLGANIFTLGFKFLPELKALLRGGIPKLVLIAEFTGNNAAEVAYTAGQAERALAPFGLRTHITKNENESEKYWVIRRESFNLLRNHVHGKHTAPFIDDVVVRPDVLPAFLPRLYAILDAYDITYTIAGHIGDGNLHIIPLMDFSRPDFETIIAELSKRVYALVMEYHGSISGEHNDGLIRTQFLPSMYNADIITLFEQTKDIFDPQRIFNPGKKVYPDATHTRIKHT